MNIIFLTMATLKEVDSHGIYSDLMRKFRDEDTLCPVEKAVSQIPNRHIPNSKNRTYYSMHVDLSQPCLSGLPEAILSRRRQ